MPRVALPVLSAVARGAAQGAADVALAWLRDATVGGLFAPAWPGQLGGWVQDVQRALDAYLNTQVCARVTVREVLRCCQAPSPSSLGGMPAQGTLRCLLSSQIDTPADLLSFASSQLRQAATQPRSPLLHGAAA